MQQPLPLTVDEQRLAPLPSFPTMYDLPSDDPEESGLPDEFHGLQPHLLSITLKLAQYNSANIFTAYDLNLYYDLANPLWHKRPDWFLVVGVPRLYEGSVSRESYVMWQEKVAPTVIVEFLSPSTAVDDLGRFATQSRQQARVTPATGEPPSKFAVYEAILQVPHYVVFNQRDSQLRYFRLVNGRYEEQPILPTNPRLWIPELEIGLALWQGEYRGIPQDWLRWCDANGNLIPTDAEAAREQRDRAEAQLRQTVLNLLAMGMESAQVSEITGVALAVVEALQASTNPQNP